MFINTYYLHWEDWPTAPPYSSLPPITPPSFDSTPTSGIYIRPPRRAQTHSTFNDDTLYGRNRPPLPMKSNFPPKNTEVSFATAQTEESANGNA